MSFRQDRTAIAAALKSETNILYGAFHSEFVIAVAQIVFIADKPSEIYLLV